MSSESDVPMNMRFMLLVLPLLGSVACSSSDDGGLVPASSGGASQSSLAGTYRGSYGGDAEGDVTMLLGADGTLAVTAEVNGIDEKGEGKVAANGSVSIGIGAKNGVVVTFDGTFANGRASGTWRSNLSTSGSWSASK
jgi:hypothetical protein